MMWAHYNIERMQNQLEAWIHLRLSVLGGRDLGPGYSLEDIERNIAAYTTQLIELRSQAWTTPATARTGSA